MNLGDKIYQLRTKANLSQGDLADALDVSRQSISKWETSTSVPELDKLIKLGELFHISLDELVLDKPTAAETSAPEIKIIYTEKAATGSTRKTAGVVLLCFSALVWLILSLLGDFLSGLVFALPFLWCCWVLYLFVELYLRFATGVSVRFVLNPLAYAVDVPAHLLVGWALLLLYIVLTVITVYRFRVPVSDSKKRNILTTITYWCVYLGIGLFLRFFQMVEIEAVAPMRAFSLIYYLVSTVQNLLLVAAITYTTRLVATLRKKKTSQ